MVPFISRKIKNSFLMRVETSRYSRPQCGRAVSRVGIGMYRSHRHCLSALDIGYIEDPDGTATVRCRCSC